MTGYKLDSISLLFNVPGVDTTVCMVTEGESKELVDKAIDHTVKNSEKGSKFDALRAQTRNSTSEGAD